MTELECCPFCGSEDLRTVDCSDGWYVYCRACSTRGPEHDYLHNRSKRNKEKAMHAAIDGWNTRYESTCRWNSETSPEGHHWIECSKCGWQCDMDYVPYPDGFMYCPNCGAKVVDE